LAIANFGLVYKNLLYKTIIAVIFGTVLVITLKLRFRPLLNSFKPVITELQHFFEMPEYNKEALLPLEEAFKKFWTYISASYGSMIGTAAIIETIFIFYNLFSGISDCTLTILANDYMSSLSHMNFLTTMVSHLKKIMKYQLFTAIFNIVTDLVIFFFAYLLFSAVSHIMFLLAVFMTALFILSTVALKFTFMSQAMSNALISDKKFKKSIIFGLKPNKKYFGRMFSSYFVALLIYFYFFVTSLIFTLGTGLVILVPFSSLVFVCLRLIDYYIINCKKYFINYDTIIVPKELRENDEKLLNQIEI